MRDRQYDLDQYEAPFLAKVTAATFASSGDFSGQYLYTWSAYAYDPTTGLPTATDNPREGSPTANPATEVNNTLIDLPAYVWMRYKTTVDAEALFEFSAGQQPPPVPFVPTSSLGFIQATPVSPANGSSGQFSGSLTISTAGYYLLSYLLPVTMSVGVGGVVSFITQLFNNTTGGFLGANLSYSWPGGAAADQGFFATSQSILFECTGVSQQIEVWYDVALSGSGSVTFGGSGGIIQAIQIP